MQCWRYYTCLKTRNASSTTVLYHRVRYNVMNVCRSISQWANFFVSYQGGECSLSISVSLILFLKCLQFATSWKLAPNSCVHPNGVFLQDTLTWLRGRHVYAINLLSNVLIPIVSHPLKLIALEMISPTVSFRTRFANFTTKIVETGNYKHTCFQITCQKT